MSTLIIIPTLRERENLVKLIPAIFQHIPDADILIADDHSEDGTKELAKEHVAVLDRVTDHGYGKAVLDGFRWAVQRGYDRIVTMDADFSHDPKEIPKLLEKLSTFDVAIGSRYVAGGGIQNWSWHRRLLSRGANWYVRAVLCTGIRDNTTGFMAYRRHAMEKLLEIPPQSDGYAFLVEVKYMLSKQNFRISEHPILYAERREGQSKMSMQVIWESIWLPWKLKYGKMHK